VSDSAVRIGVLAVQGDVREHLSLGQAMVGISVAELGEGQRLSKRGW